MIRSLQCDVSIASAYRNPTQIARVVSECWCSENLYCAACDADSLQQAAANTKALDFRCVKWSETYQIKSQRNLNLTRITDGAYSTMLDAVQRNVAPNLVIMNYAANWTVQNLVLIPSLFFVESVLERRKPLSSQARRAGWVGCNFLLANVPTDGKIALIQDQAVVPADDVRETYSKYRKLESLDWNLRGWTVDVLRMVRKIGKSEFTLEDIYKYEAELTSLHPKNRNVRPKIRQQLQVLRDMRILDFIGSGRYRVIAQKGNYEKQMGQS